MRLLHTADWHLGKIVNGVHMTDDQAYMIEQLFQIIEQYRPDVVMIAGDIYDRSVPPKEAVELLDYTFTKLLDQYSIPILVISGNHDSPDRLHFGSRIFRRNRLLIEAKLSKDIEVFSYADQFGPVHFYLIPYFDPAEVRTLYGDDSVQTHQDAMKKVIESIKERFDQQARHVCITHAFIAGGMESDSEERLTMIGGSPYIDHELFDCFDYVALGHLHQAQKIQREAIQYSGSILKYSFSEAKHKKSVNLVELKQDGSLDIERIQLKPKRDMRILEDYFDQLLNDDCYPGTDDYLHIRLLDDGQLLDPISQLRKKFPNILRLERKVKQSDLALDQLKTLQERQKMSHEELFTAFYRDMKGEDISLQRKKIINDLISELIKQERGE
ncbi:exonuclease SbcCD subunit D [Amphibacillus sediminis]|uniref:exonuclease SbcCD subunit D n=1 Tax=Amphibacillus sediminis TaxID=360185 RepID=UPI0008328DD6|nr:exonuclease SbcCD subunit D [Amphibacillus sediminis]